VAKVLRASPAKLIDLAFVPSLEAALHQYDNLVIELEGFQGRVWALMTLILGSLAALASYSSFPQAQFTGPLFSPVIAWLLPLVFLTLISFWLYMLYLSLNDVFLLRIVVARINKLLPGEDALLHYNRRAPPGAYLSMRVGGLGPRISFTLAIVLALILFALVGYFCFQSASIVSALSGTVFVIFYGSSASLVALSATMVFVEMPKFYAGNQLEDYSHHPLQTFPVASSHTSARILAFILPRRKDAAKWLYYVYGVLLAVALRSKLDDARILFANRFLSPSSAITWSVAHAVPPWVVLSLVILCFFAQEILLQQAKLLWDDIRDHKRDVNSSINKSRSLAAGMLTLTSAIPLVVVRWIAAFTLGSLLGRDFLVLFLTISVHHVVYELAVKPLSGRRPRFTLFYLSFSVPIRVVGGMLILGSIQDPLYVAQMALVSAVFYLSTVGGLAAQWWAEVPYCRKKGERRFRPQSSFFWKDDRRLQTTALCASVLSSLCLLALSLIPSDVWGKLTPPAWPAQAAVFGALTSGTYLLSRIGLRWIRALLLWVTKSQSKRVFVALTSLSLVLSIIGLLAARTSVTGAVLLVAFSTSYFFMLHDATYEEIAMLDLRENLLGVARAMSRYFFEAESGISLRKRKKSKRRK